MTAGPIGRRVVVLAPMPLEADAIVRAFGLDGPPASGPWTGRVGGSEITAVHIGMGPAATRVATERVLTAEGPPVAHVMVAGICGGLDPSRPVGTLVNPEVVVDQTSGAAFEHHPPGEAAREGRLLTTEGVNLDLDLARTLFDDGYLAVDMETAAVAEVCEAHGCPWSAYRCIGDRPFDGLLDERLVALTNPDGSGRTEDIERLLAAEPDLAPKLARLARETAQAARLAAEAAVRGCQALDT